MGTPLDTAIEDVLDTKLRSVDVYKQYAPVIKTETGYTIHITDDIVEAAEYARVVDTLRNALPTDTVILYVTSNGGYLDSADLLRQSIIKSNATVVGRAAGTVASAGTVIFLACDEFEISPTTQFLFHEGTGGGGAAKASDAQAYQDFLKKHLPEVFQAAYGELLTKKEHTAILKGTELFLSGKTVAERLAALGRTVY